ncbi:uncharacterized protein LOC115986356 isoform X2 [Quercus lobata]|uniref:uncharacterized protein LOC115986356 isoform X2 n=1 Tax=Quercus lobata TaxID=97700 RepID=UPI0012460424|nr:uncharacterized protein LOC115986356 isoform X2 [Quercus lobata]
METRIASSAAVSEVLNVDNYLVWSIQVRTYLIAQDLWDIVQATKKRPKLKNDKVAFKAWSKKNAMALHVIQISCPQQICHVISLITFAKIAWETLESICSIPKSDYFEKAKESCVAWSNRMKSFLMEHDLWNIVETTTEPTTPTWSKKNALALYLIRESCGSDRFSLIEKISKAKDAWDEIADSGMKNYENGRFNQYVSLEKHIREGEWEAANQFISSNPEAVIAKISISRSTALHIAIFEGHLNIVEELVKIMSEEDLKIKDAQGNTVLGYCSMVGNIQMAKCIIGKSRTSLSIGNGSDDLIPVVLALTYNPSGTEMARYLYSQTPLEDLMPRNGINGVMFITRAIYSKAIDMALDLLERHPELAIAPDYNGWSPVEVLAGMSFAYRSGNRLVYWKEWIYNSICIPLAHDTNQIPISIRKSEMEKCGQARNIRSARGSVWNLLKFLEIDKIYELKLLHHQSKILLLHMCRVLRGLNFQQLENGGVIEAIIKAVKDGRIEFVAKILKEFPELVWCVEKSTGRNIFMLVVLYRQDEVFHFLCRSPEKNSILARVDFDSNSILHFAAMLEPFAKPNKAPGAALLMQREVHWFKEVQRVVHPSTLERTNKNGQTPRQLFIESHKELMKEGEKWVKEIANSCAVVGALIVSIMFAAAITVPGGNKQESGLPMFLNAKVFMLFIIFDALSLLSASYSLLMFLNLTLSSYEAEDFLQSLPKKCSSRTICLDAIAPSR